MRVTAHDYCVEKWVNVFPVPRDSTMAHDAWSWFLPNIGPLLTAVALFLTVWTLKRNHDWNRRQYASNMVAEWNTKTSIHRKAIENLKPGLIDEDPNNTTESIVELTKQEAKAIYCSDPNNPDQKALWELRFHFIELLNHFESIAIAYRNGVGDREIIEEAFRNVLVRWRKILHEFIDMVECKRGYKPWQPYTDLVAFWEERPYKFRPTT
jgi:hypothetical protein